jgi:hypothetical protein
VWPIGDVDHINGDRADNSPENLRECSRSENNMNQRHARTNNTSGERGVSFDNARGKWRAYISSNGSCKMLGRFDTVEDAVRVRRAAMQETFGEFAPI